MAVISLIIGLMLLAGAALTWAGVWRGWAAPQVRGPFTDRLYLPPLLAFAGLAAVLWAVSGWTAGTVAGTILDVAAGLSLAGVVFTLIWWSPDWMPRWYRELHSGRGRGGPPDRR